MVRVEFLLPQAWRDALYALARRQAISAGDVLRIMVAGFMRERLTEAQQRELGIAE